MDWLLQSISNLDRLALRLETYREQEFLVLNRSLEELTQLWQRRLLQRCPLQQLLGIAHWRQFELQVSPAVLIPRPETESLIDLAIASTQRQPALSVGHWVDLGTGSGAIAIGLATALPGAKIHAVDRSAEAIEIASRNAQNLQVQFYQGDWFALLEHLKGQCSGIVSNPPYIPSAMVPELQPEVAWHEPHLALDGGPDGLDAIRKIVAISPQYLRPGGLLLLEMMAGQDSRVRQLLEQQDSYAEIQIHADLAGIARFAQAYRK